MSIEDLIRVRHPKEVLLEHLAERPQEKAYLAEKAALIETDISWRAAWLMTWVMKKNSPYLAPHLKTMISNLPEMKDGHQRECLKLLEKMKVPGDLEGDLFDHCAEIWQDLDKSPSVRIISLRILLSYLSEYPELADELDYLLAAEYIKPLTPGIKRSCEKLLMKYGLGHKMSY